jgi:ribosome-associated protein
MPMKRSSESLPGERAVLRAKDLPADVAAAVESARDRKGRDLVVLDLRGLSTATDFFFIGTGTSDIHVRGMAEHIIDELKRTGVRPDHVEGLRGGRWVLIDYIDFVIHLFHPAAREFYQLEHLWGDALRLDVES